MSGVRMMLVSKDWWKFNHIHQYYTTALKQTYNEEKESKYRGNLMCEYGISRHLLIVAHISLEQTVFHEHTHAGKVLGKSKSQ